MRCCRAATRTRRTQQQRLSASCSSLGARPDRWGALPYIHLRSAFAGSVAGPCIQLFYCAPDIHVCACVCVCVYVCVCVCVNVTFIVMSMLCPIHITNQMLLSRAMKGSSLFHCILWFSCEGELLDGSLYRLFGSLHRFFGSLHHFFGSLHHSFAIFSV